MVVNGELFQTVFLNLREQRSQSLIQIQGFQESSMLLTTVVCLCQLTQVARGRNLILHGQKDIFHKLLGLLQLTRGNPTN